MANSISIELELDDSGAIKKINGLEQKAKRAGKKAADNIEDPLTQSFKNVTKRINATAIAFAALGGAAFVFKNSIQAAEIQEQAIDRLNQQLKLTGELTARTTSDLVQFAASLQQISEFGDELIIDQIALAKSFGATNEQAKQIASTAIDLSKSFGISLESATRNAARTLGGFAGELGEVIPELKNLTAEQLRAGEGVNLLQSRFDGAGKNLNTFSFSTAQAGNAFGDLLEAFGNFVVKNDAIIAGLKLTTEAINDAARRVRVLGNFVNSAFAEPRTNIDKLTAQIKDSSLELERYQKLSESLKLGFFGLTDSVETKASRRAAARARKEAERLKDLRRQLREAISERAELRDQESKIESKTAEKRITDAELIAQAAIKAEAILVQASAKRFEALEQLRQRDLISEQDFSDGQIQIKRELEQQLADLETARVERQIEQNESLTDAVALAVKQQQTSYVELGKTVKQLSVQGFGNAFQNIGRALAEGGNAAEAFTNTIKATFGDLASAIGDFYIKRGIAQTAAGDPGGPAVIAAGAALKVLSGVLGATASGGSGGGAQAVQDVGSSSVETGNVATAEPQQEEQTTNQIIVQGDVFDSEETGLRIFDIISEQSEKNGNVIIGGAFA